MTRETSSLKRVLLVDDDADDRELFEEAVKLVNPSLLIDTARDGEELMQYIKNTIPDVIFLDLNMPKKNGKECLVEIRSDSKFSNIPVIIYTTSLNQVDIAETKRNGASYFFRKPNSFDELKDVLHQILVRNKTMQVAGVESGFVLNETVPT
ncbi:MAG TPA: response regulator [Chryseosolibacter sp.]|nr:response regulator [Chryseosolibacter sp.]